MSPGTESLLAQGPIAGLVPILPVRVQPPDEVIRRRLEDLTTERDRLVLKLLSALVDTAEEGGDGLRTAETFRIARHLAPEHGKVVVITQKLPEAVGFVREGPQHSRFQRAEELELMAEISGLLPPFVEMLDRGCLRHRRERSPAPAVDSLHAFFHAGPSVLHVRPLIEAAEGVLHARVHGLEGVFVGENLVSNFPLVTEQFFPHVPERAPP